MAGLNEPLKPAPQVFAADLQVRVINFNCTFAEQLYKLMAYIQRSSICNSLHHYTHKILQLFLQSIAIITRK